MPALYSRVPSGEDSEQRSSGSRSSNTRWLIVVGFGVIGVFYLSMSVRSAGSMSTVTRYMPSSMTSFAHAEHDSLRDENRRLKEMLAAAEEAAQKAARQREAEATAKMASFAEAAWKPAAAAGGAGGAAAGPVSDNDFMKGIMRGLTATVENPAAAAASVGAKAESWMQAATAAVAPSLQQTLHTALAQSPPPPSAAAASSSSSLAGGGKKLDPADYRLTKERVKAHCDQHNIILVTFVNSKRADYAYTWAWHVRRLGLSNYLVGAMDGEALVKLVDRNIEAFDMESGLTTADYGWGTKNFRQLGLRKTELIINLLRAGADPVLTDADALITRDPSPFIVRLLPEAQVLVTSDHLASTTSHGDLELEEPQRAHPSAWNIGYMYLRHDVLPAMLHWQSECAAHPNLWDQNLFKDVLKIGGCVAAS